MLLIMKNSNSLREKQVLRGVIIAGWLNLCGVDVFLKVKMFFFFVFFVFLLSQIYQTYLGK